MSHKDMKLVIEFGVPMKVSGSVYKYDTTTIIGNGIHKLYVYDVRDSTYYNIRRVDSRKVQIGTCNIIKDNVGIWISDIKSTIDIEEQVLFPAVIGTAAGASTYAWSNGYSIVTGSIECIYISIEENTTEWIRDRQLKRLGI